MLTYRTSVRKGGRNRWDNIKLRPRRSGGTPSLKRRTFMLVITSRGFLSLSRLHLSTVRRVDLLATRSVLTFTHIFFHPLRAHSPVYVCSRIFAHRWNPAECTHNFPSPLSLMLSAVCTIFFSSAFFFLMTRYKKTSTLHPSTSSFSSSFNVFPLKHRWE